MFHYSLIILAAAKRFLWRNWLRTKPIPKATESSLLALSKNVNRELGEMRVSSAQIQLARVFLNLREDLERDA